MVTVANNQDFTAASGLIGIGFLESIYHSVIDETFLDLGRTVVFHLQPQIQQDTTTQSSPQPNQYNPFFGSVGTPHTNTRDTGVRVEPRDVPYEAHIRIGPSDDEDIHGIGELKSNQIQLTVVIEALQHVKEALSFSVEGRRYEINTTRPIGFTKRRYLMVLGTEINETEAQSPKIEIG
jgi:hypothetical protein